MFEELAGAAWAEVVAAELFFELLFAAILTRASEG